MHNTSFIIGLAAIGLTAAGAFAQDEQPQPLDDSSLAQEAATSSGNNLDFRFTVGGAYTHRFETDIDSGGDFSVDTFSAGLTIEKRLSEDFGLAFQTNYVASVYDFNNIGNFGVLDPWDDIHTFNFGLAMSYNINERFSVFGGPVIQFSGESGADWGDAFTGGGIVGGTWRVNDRLLIGGGAGIMSQIEDDVRVTPILIIEWQLSEQWRISTRGPRAGRASLEFTGVELVWEPSKQWEFAIGGARGFSRFRLSDNNVFNPGGVGQDESIPVWVRASWQPTNNFAIDAIGGFSFNGELSLDDSNGNGLARSDYDPQPVLGVLAIVTF